MSSDIYIPLDIVLTHPASFGLRVDYNVGIEGATEALNNKPTDWNWVEDCLRPVLLVKFGARETWRYVSVIDRDLHISCSGTFREWLQVWLTEHNFKYEIH